MKISYANLSICLILMPIIFACNKEIIKTEEVVRISYDNVDLRNLDNDLTEIWEYAWDTYGMEAVCSCNCDSYFAAKGTIDSHLGIVENYIESTNVGVDSFDVGCNNFINRMKFECQFSNIDNRLINLYNVIDSFTFAPSEKDFIEEIISRTDSLGYFDEDYFVNSWNEMDSINDNSDYNYFFSAFIVELSISIESFVVTNDISGIQGVDEGNAILSHIGGAIMGGLMGVAVEGFYSVAFEDPPSVTWGDIKKSAIKGAFTGAITAI